MCDPVTASLLLAGAAGLSAYGAIQQGNAAQDAANAQAREVSMEAGRGQDAAAAQADLIRKAAKRQVGEARASLSVSGVAVDEGTPVKIGQEITRGGEFDALNTILGASRNAQSAQSQSVIYGKQGAAAKRAGQIQATSSLLQAGASAGMASGWRSAGPGFSGTQAAAPISSANVVRVNG